MTDWRADVSDRGFAFLHGHSSSAIGDQLGRSSGSELLTPRDGSVADPWSLSGAYGLGAFPWHTDGAISTKPPHWILLRAIRVTQGTCTELLDPEPELRTALRRTVLQARGRAGRIRHLPAAIPHDGGLRLRWDPRICIPKTGISIAEVEQKPPTAVVQWREDLLLIVDNTRLLHRRPPVDGRAVRELERTYVWKY